VFDRWARIIIILNYVGWKREWVITIYGESTFRCQKETVSHKFKRAHFLFVITKACSYLQRLAAWWIHSRIAEKDEVVVSLPNESANCARRETVAKRWYWPNKFKCLNLICLSSGYLQFVSIEMEPACERVCSLLHRRPRTNCTLWRLFSACHYAARIILISFSFIPHSEQWFTFAFKKATCFTLQSIPAGIHNWHDTQNNNTYFDKSRENLRNSLSFMFKNVWGFHFGYNVILVWKPQPSAEVCSSLCI
jgi:hypothetical protein